MPAIDVLSEAARRALLRVLACAAAADGDVTAEEIAALRGAQIALGLVGEGLPLDSLLLSRIDVSVLSSREKMLVYAAAAWMALADGVRTNSESQFLEQLRARLGLDRETAGFMAAHARWTRASTDLTWHRELEALVVQGARRIDQVAAHAA
jgi:uncharacterized membrane protein YebE (DUF533 family)